MKQTFPHHIFHRADELVVEEQMLRLVFWVGSRVKHSTHGAAHCSEMLLPGILQNEKGKKTTTLNESDFLYIRRTECKVPAVKADLKMLRVHSTTTDAEIFITS